MRNLIALIAIAAVMFVQGCYSSVKTWDSDGNLIGECTGSTMLLGFIPTWGPGCRGSANPLDQSANETLRPLPQEKLPGTQCPTGQSLRGQECYPDNSLLKQMLDSGRK